MKQAYLYQTYTKATLPRGYRCRGIFNFESQSDWGRICEMAPVRILINSHWVPSLPNAPGKDEVWEEASPAAATSQKLGLATNYKQKVNEMYRKP